MYRTIKFFMLALLGGWGLSGCYPGGAEFTEDIDAVYTNHLANFDFQGKSTYALPDKIVVDVQVQNDGDTVYVYMKDAYAQPLLNAIDANMSSLGWTKVDVNNNPDIVVTPAGIKNTTYFYSYWYCWWYGGYWGWYYPPYYTVSSYTTGSFIMVMADPTPDDSAINQSPAAWVAVGNGLFTGNNDLNRALGAIDQAFAQSPYLKTN